MSTNAFDETACRNAYEKAAPFLEDGLEQLNRRVSETIRIIKQWHLARARLLDSRIKELGSLERKARNEGWSGTEAMSRADDLLGARVVCNNLTDVRELVRLLKESIEHDPNLNTVVTVDDYITQPKPDGYRAIHLKFRLELPTDDVFSPLRVACEVQVRTLLQDSWARLAHSDVYKAADDLPVDLRHRLSDLSRHLSSADEVAQEVRNRIAESREPPSDRPDLTKVSPDGLTYIYALTFGTAPSEYVVRAAEGRVRDAGLTSLTEVEQVLGNPTFRDAVATEYADIVPWPSDPDPTELFLIAPIAAARGMKAARKEARRRAKADRDYIDSFWRSEVQNELPGTADAFVENLDELPIGMLADFFGVQSECWICGTDIIDPEAFELAVAKHYGVDGFDGKVAEYLYHCGLETGSFDHEGLCAYHGNALEKDD